MVGSRLGLDKMYSLYRLRSNCANFGCEFRFMVLCTENMVAYDVFRNNLVAFVSGFLPGVVLKIFLLIIPYVLRELTTFEGHVSYSQIEKLTAVKYYAFLVVNVFFGNVLIGSLFDQLKAYIAAPTT